MRLSATDFRYTPSMNTSPDLNTLLKTMNPVLRSGEYVFCTVNNLSKIDLTDILLFFREEEGMTIITRKETADRLNLSYTFVAAWIMLAVNSSLEAVGLTAAFSSALASEGISCNVVAAFHHDHLFVNLKDAEKALAVLSELSEQVKVSS